MELVDLLEVSLMSLLLVFVVVCGITDLLQQRIWDVVTWPAMALGLLLNLAFLFVDGSLGLRHFGFSLLALLLGFGIFLVLFTLGGLGGGDVKFMAAVGAFDPFHFGHIWIFWAIFFSVMAGGVISLVVMTMKGQLLKSLRNVFRTIFTFLTPGMRIEALKPENSEKIPFGYGIAVGTLWTILLFQSGILPN